MTSVWIEELLTIDNSLGTKVIFKIVGDMKSLPKQTKVKRGSLMIFISIMFVIILIAAWGTILWQPRSMPAISPERPLLMGHRGVRELEPENTIPAFKMAFDAGLHGVEFDVLRSRDGKLVLHHDFVLSEGQVIADLSYEEILAIDERIPLLEELFELTKAYPKILLNLEIKSETLRSDGLEPAVVKAVRASGLAEQVLISSFNPISILRVRLLAPELRTALLFYETQARHLRHGSFARWLHVDAIHPHIEQVDAEMVARAKSRSLMINTWTVNDPNEVKRVRDLGIDAIMADDPEALKQAALD